MQPTSRWYSKRRILTIIGLAVWMGGLSAGFGAFQAYKVKPGESEIAPVANTTEQSPSDNLPQARLMMFVHPHCPCTRASLEELQRAMTNSSDPALVEVLLVKPDDVAPGWEQGISAKSAVAIPGVQVRSDNGGMLARRYGAATSGHVVFYDRDGNLRFSGGITRQRGHAGDNPGSRAIAALLNGQSPETSQTPVYGCPLLRASDCSVTGATCGSKQEASIHP